MPFCKGITAVVGPMIGLICAPAFSTSQSLTQNRTKRTEPMVAGSSRGPAALRSESGCCYDRHAGRGRGLAGSSRATEAIAIPTGSALPREPKCLHGEVVDTSSVA